MVDELLFQFDFILPVPIRFARNQFATLVNHVCMCVVILFLFYLYVNNFELEENLSHILLEILIYFGMWPIADSKQQKTNSR